MDEVLLSPALALAPRLIHAPRRPPTAPQDYPFGAYTVHASEVFATTPLSYAFVNLKPVLPGHVLVSPKRVAPRFGDLSADEVADVWTLAQCVGVAIEPHLGATSLTFAVQDGADAGQTVPHVHIHVLPRRPGDFPNNDEVYDAIDAASKDAANGLQEKKKGAGFEKHMDLDEERKPRTAEEMAAEAAELRKLF